MTTDDYKKLSVLIERVVHKYSQIEQQSWDYGNGVMLSRPEIHSIMLVKTYPGISLTALAKKRGITKGAASQLIYKMVDKGLVEKRISPQSDAQISLYLTDAGLEINRLHNEYHKNNSQPIHDYFNSLSDETVNALIGTMELFDKQLDERLPKK